MAKGKLGRNKDSCKAYKAADREQVNRKRRWRSDIRNNPKNAQLRKRYEAVFGPYEESREPSNRIRRRAALGAA